ncbi:MAG: hypothetical protein ACOVO1_11355 [Chitinophagaceae bacterium]
MTSSKTKNILFTFDYELFLGSDSGTLDISLINPTKKLLQLFKKNKLQAIFFVDTTYIMMLDEVRGENALVNEDFNKINNQLVEIVKEGHLIYPHIHPHWLDAVYSADKNTWNLSNDSKYRFSSIDAITQQMLFNYSINILNNILKTANVNQVIDSYRAGGWSIQPFNTFKPYFLQYGIQYEFSVIPGKYCISPAHQYDFYNAPNKEIYSFENDINIEDVNGSFKAITISVLEFPKIIGFALGKMYVLLSHYLKLQFVQSIGNGKTVHHTKVENKDKYFAGKQRKIVSFEYLDFITVFLQLHQIKKNKFCHFISHPKMMSKMNFVFTAFLLKRIARKYKVESDFHQFT